LNALSVPKQEVARSTVLLFSGGRDSTAAALKLYERGDSLHLLSFRSGLTLHDGYRALRVDELKNVLVQPPAAFHEIDIRGLIRKICFVDLVEDVVADGCQLILLGEAICMFTAAIEFAVKHQCSHVAYGVTGYQSSYPEQRPEFVRLLEQFLSVYKLSLDAPGLSWTLEDQPKEILRMSGLSTKSLEATSLLSDIDDHQPVDAVVAYAERKIRLASQLLSERLPRR